MDYIEQNINSTLSKILEKYPERLFKAIEYSVLSGGKRIRPYLMLLSAEFLSIPKEKVINQAIALELIHTYSLIHDDLPSMDNDDLRRGKPTVHKAFGEAIAVLAGDALLNLSYEILLKTALDDSALTRSCYYISLNAGGQGMVGGQALEFSNLNIDLPLYEKICALKTGALINGAVLTPAFIQSNEKEFDALQKFGGCIGLIFQLVDDLIDIDKDDASFVKLAGKDAVIQKINVLQNSALDVLIPFGDRAENLINFCNFLTNRTN